MTLDETAKPIVEAESNVRLSWPVAAERRSKDRKALATDCVFDRTRPLADALRRRVIGQDDAIEPLICSYSRLLSGLRNPQRPLLTALLVGPTGVGKTETARAVSEALFGSDAALTRVNAEEYAQAHQVSKLLGSPPGYVGFQIEPLLSQRRIEEPHRRLREAAFERPGRGRLLADELTSGGRDELVSLILFDEIEKAHPSVWNALLGILEEGELTLGDNSTTSFTNSIILMTSNVGSGQMSELLGGRQMGFGASSDRRRVDDSLVAEAALEAARKAFPLEFLNRFDELMVYSPLGRRDLDRIFDKFLVEIHHRAMHEAGIPMLIKVSPSARAHLVEVGTDPQFGARPLRRTLEKELVDPLSRFIASGRVRKGDVVDVELEDSELRFYRRQRADLALVV